MTNTSKAVLITGALGGIGKALCTEFRKAGYFVIGTDLKQGDADCDVLVNLDVQDLCRKPSVVHDFKIEVLRLLESSGSRLTAIINNAATQLLNKTEEITIDEWDKTLQVNLVAPFFLVQTFLSQLEANSGSVVNIASVHATATKPDFVCYATSKSALVGMTKAMAVDLGSKMRINAISPAAVATPMLLAGFEGRDEEFKKLARMHPAGRIGIPAEIAKVALFLCSEAAGFITGSCLAVDGGIGSRLHDPV